jgi:hypothetical protein
VCDSGGRVQSQNEWLLRKINVGRTPERTMNMSTKDQVQTGAVIRRQEDASNDCVFIGGAQKIEGNSLVLTQVNRRIILINH